MKWHQDDGLIRPTGGKIAVVWWSRGQVSPGLSRVGSCHVYEIEGRLLLRTVDMSGGLGIEREDTAVVDGFPGVEAAALGAALVEAMHRTREIPRPTSWPRLSEHAQPLLAASPGRFRSYRSWQRAARYVSVHARPDSISITRWHPDLSRGSWTPAGDVGRPVGDWPQKIDLPATASATEIGVAVIEALGQPSLRDAN